MDENVRHELQTKLYHYDALCADIHVMENWMKITEPHNVNGIMVYSISAGKFMTIPSGFTEDVVQFLRQRVTDKLILLQAEKEEL